MNNTFLLFYSPKPWSQVCIKVKFMQKRLININGPPSVTILVAMGPKILELVT